MEINCKLTTPQHIKKSLSLEASLQCVFNTASQLVGGLTVIAIAYQGNDEAATLAASCVPLQFKLCLMMHAVGRTESRIYYCHHHTDILPTGSVNICFTMHSLHFL